MKTPFTVVAIDGGAASGKSTTARALAARYHWLHVDTGSHYRALTHALLESATPPEAGPALEAFLQQARLTTRIEGHSAHLLVSGKPANAADLRRPEVNASVSGVAAIPAVRQHLFHYQRSHVALAREHGFDGLVMEGRDIGSVILPDADLRLFLEADTATRSARRQQEGQRDSIATRDRLDSTRESAPLRCVDGAVRLDTGTLSPEQVVATIARYLNLPTP